MSVWGPIAMQRCETCRWWGEKIHSPPWCKPPYEHRTCDAISTHESTGRRKLLAIIVDQYESNSGVYTLADFGCVLHEPKEQA
jgi:hypothetical protein